MEGCGLSLVVLPFLRLLGVMGRKQHHCELAAFLAFGIETVAQVASLPLFILASHCIRSAAASHWRRKTWFSDPPSLAVSCASAEGSVSLETGAKTRNNSAGSIA